MNWRHATVVLLVARSLAAPAFGATASPSPSPSSSPAPVPSAQPGTLGYAAWSAATADQKVLIVQGEADGLITGYFEPLLVLTITSMLTGSKDITTVKDRLSQTIPAYSKKPAEYVASIDALYQRPAVQKLSVGNVLACLGDHPPGVPAVSTDDCIKSFL